MADSIFIAIPDQINKSTPIIIVRDVSILHKPVEQGGDELIPEKLEANEGDYIKFSAINGEFDLELDANYFEPSGLKPLKIEEILLVQIKGDFKEISIPFDCKSCPSIPSDGRKKIIVRNAGETKNARLEGLLSRIEILQNVISKKLKN